MRDAFPPFLSVSRVPSPLISIWLCQSSDTHDAELPNPLHHCRASRAIRGTVLPRLDSTPGVANTSQSMIAIAIAPPIPRIAVQTPVLVVIALLLWMRLLVEDLIRAAAVGWAGQWA